MQEAIRTAVIVLVGVALVAIGLTVLYGFLDSRRSLKIGTHSKMRTARTTPAPIEDGESAGGNTAVGRSESQVHRRSLILGALVAGALGTLFVKVWSMQILESEAYGELAQANYTTSSATRAARGRILDRNGEVLAGNRATKAVVCNAEVADDRALVHRLSNVLGIPKVAVKQRIDDTSEGAQAMRLVCSDAPLRAVAFILEHPQIFQGVQIEQRTVRIYPQGTLAAHVIGYVGTITQEELETMSTPDGQAYSSGDIVGKSGIEATYESVLQGVKGSRTVEVDAAGNVLRVIDEVEPKPGSDVMLTLDLGIQQQCEQSIQDAFQRAKSFDFPNADAGSAIVLDLEDNAVLALANYPTYSPAELAAGISDEIWEELSSEQGNYPLTNRAIAGLYPSGSTIKPFSSMAALKYGLVTTSDGFYCTGVWTALGEQWAKKCWLETGHGAVDLIEGIAYSCDVVFYELALRFYNYEESEVALQDEFTSWGLGKKTDIDLPSEKEGRIPTPEWKAEFNADTPEAAQWNPGDTANIIIGQGDVLVTPIQDAIAYSGLANGVIYKPHLLREVLGSDGQAVITHESEVLREPEYRQEDLDIVRQGLVAQVRQNGNLNSMSVLTAGKTGTAQVTNKDDMGWYAGYGPQSDPKYLILCMIEQAGSGGSVCSPMFREIFDACMGIEDDSAGEVTFDGSR